MPKLLIVDDEKDVTEFAKKFFLKRGIDVFTASGGMQAIMLIEEEKPDLVLLDVQMEEMSGIEVLRKLRELQNQTPVIMVTGVEDESVIKEVKSLGVREYIHKPLILEELEKVVLAELEK